MKKTYITNENTSESSALFIGLDTIYGGWLLETNGNPTCLNELEDADCETEIASINEIIADPATPWEPLTPEDKEYIRLTLESWGM